MHDSYAIYQPAKGKNSSVKWVAITLIVLFLVCGGSAVACTAIVGVGANAVEQENKAKRNDVKLVACEDGALLDIVTARFEVKNSGSSRRLYFISFDIMQGETKVGDGFASADVDAGQTAIVEGVGSHADINGLTCKVTSVS